MTFLSLDSASRSLCATCVALSLAWPLPAFAHTNRTTKHEENNAKTRLHSILDVRGQPGPSSTQATSVKAVPTAPAPTASRTDAPVTQPEGSSPTANQENNASEQPQSAPSDDKRAQAREQFNLGKQAYAVGNYQSAIVHFESAWELSGEPVMLYNLAFAYWKRYDVHPEIDHLRKARALFANFDKLMGEGKDPRQNQRYDHAEVVKNIEQLDIQIAEAQKRQDEVRLQEAAITAEAREKARSRGPTADELATRRRIATDSTLVWTGNIAIILGSLTTLAALGGLAVRGTTGFILKQADNEDFNPNSAKEDRNYRQAYSTGGRVAFGALVATGILLPVGITLRITGRARQRQFDQELRNRAQQGTQARLRFGGPLLRVDF